MTLIDEFKNARGTTMLNVSNLKAEGISCGIVIGQFSDDDHLLMRFNIPSGGKDVTRSRGNSQGSFKDDRYRSHTRSARLAARMDRITCEFACGCVNSFDNRIGGD
jgi:hypothetical protein